MDVIGVIPARYESTRLPHKLLKNLCGKPVLQWTWEKARRAAALDKVVIASDDRRIKDAAESFGAECVMTSDKHNSGTDRVAEALGSIDASIVVNIQADEPLIHPSLINDLARTMKADKTLVMATAKVRIKDAAYDSPSVVKVVCDKDGFALYFSRWAIPYLRDRAASAVYYKHLGVYAYTKDFLYTFKGLASSSLEEAEKLEQLRALEAGYRIKVIETQFDSVGVDTQDDFARVEAIIKGSING